jgi:hypothetical protein
MLALCPSEPRQNCGGWTPYSVCCTVLLFESQGKLQWMEPTPLWEVRSREEEQAAHSDPSTLLLDRDRNPPTFQNDLALATSTPMRVSAPSRRSLELCIPNWLGECTLYGVHYCTLTYNILRTLDVVHVSMPFSSFGKKTNSIVPEILLIGSPVGIPEALSIQLDL